MDGMKDADFLAQVREKFERCTEREDKNRKAALDDIKFARLGEQWPEGVRKDREDDGRPCLVINRMPSFIRQVVNTARQNRPAIRVIPADSGADPDTAEIISGLIRNIEVSSDADVAYDTAVENAVSGGFGYIAVNTAYTSDDTFDQDIVIERVADPFTIYGDPDSEAADGSDWNCAFHVKTLTKEAFAKEYKGAEKVNWDALGYTGLQAPWLEDDSVMVAAYWKREDVDAQIVSVIDRDGQSMVMDLAKYRENASEMLAMGIGIAGEPRTVKRKKVTQYIVSGAEVLETIEWPGKYIPIVPVYGDECTVEGERHFKSLIADAKDAQRELNYWRSAAAESVALAPQAPFIGPEGAFDADPEKWSTANRKSHAFMEYAGGVPPQRMAPPMTPAAEMQQAMASSDDMKAIIGLYDSSLGQQSNETSGVAIRQRQRQGDIGTFHFIDNLTRSIRQVGRILIDLIPKVYSTERVIRVLGEDMEPEAAQIAPGGAQQPEQMQGMEQGQDIQRIYDLTVGKYDLVVKAGPSYGTQRELAQAEIVEIIRAFPESAAILGPMYLRNSDWPGAEEAADKLEQGDQGGDPNAAAQMQQMQQELAKLAQENQQLKQDRSLEAQKLQIDAFRAQTERMDKTAKAQTDQVQAQADLAEAASKARAASNPFAMEGLGNR